MYFSRRANQVCPARNPNLPPAPSPRLPVPEPWQTGQRADGCRADAAHLSIDSSHLPSTSTSLVSSSSLSPLP